MSSATKTARRPGTRRHTAARVLVWTERALIAAGLICLAAWGSACAQRSLFQASEQAQFDTQILRALMAEGHDQSEWSAARVSAYEQTTPEQVNALGRLMIPAAGVSVMVLDGAEEAVLDRAVGRIPGTARVGEAGNLGIAGHRDGFFRGLRHLERGDEMTLATVAGVNRYRVSEISVVEPDAVDVLAPTPTTTITLVTCYPFYYVGSAPQRYVVKAHWVGFDTWNGDTAAAYLHADAAAP